jgi:hypothetical protein
VIDLLALEALVRRVAREEATRPEFVSQRTVLAVVGAIEPRDYLRMAREGRFPSRKERRLVVAKTQDVVDALSAAPAAATTRRTAPEFAHSRSGLRRVGS